MMIFFSWGIRNFSTHYIVISNAFHVWRDTCMKLKWNAIAQSLIKTNQHVTVQSINIFCHVFLGCWKVKPLLFSINVHMLSFFHLVSVIPADLDLKIKRKCQSFWKYVRLASVIFNFLFPSWLWQGIQFNWYTYRSLQICT